jgi:hypothetical protein
MSSTARASRFPTRSDVRTHASVVCACLVLTYLINMSAPGLTDRSGKLKGTDFIHFYELGSLALRGQSAALYDYRFQAADTAALLPESRGVFYLPIYGPQVSLLFAPFALLPYASALFVWLVVTASIYALCCAAVWRACPTLRNEALVVGALAVGSPAFFNLVAHGQNSAIALACFTAAFFALRHQKHFLAGVAIGTLIYKPTLGLAAACVFGLTLEWQIVGGAIVGSVLQLGAAWLYYGSDVMAAYWKSVRGVSNISSLLDIKPYQMHSLLTFWKYLAPSTGLATLLYVVCAAAVIVAAALVWRSQAALSIRYAVFLLATVLVSPHVNVYDLVILSPALLLVADWALSHPDHARSKPTQVLLYGTYVLPLLGALTRITHVQLSVVAMGVLFVSTTAVALGQEPILRWLSVANRARRIDGCLEC